MKSYLITYDLFRPGQKYDNLWRALESIGACRVMLSVWVVRGAWTDADLYHYLRPHIDENDRILIVGAPILYTAGWIDTDKVACAERVLT
jgi:hypothetical protein